MVQIGNYNTLQIIKKVDFGFYLDGQELGEILLPKRYASESMKVNDAIEVFIYKDSEDRLIATTEKPYAQVGEFAYLKVVAVSADGAFLDWGLSKDLLAPFREQKMTMKEGKSYVVAVFLDKLSMRVAASSKIERHLDKSEIDVVENQEVDILIANETDIGYNAIVNNKFIGLIYKNEVFQPIAKGMKCKAYIRKIREDGKIDLSLTKSGMEKITDLAPRIMAELKNNNGFLPLNDHSSAEQIYELFQESKKAFKKAIGTLYKQRLITLNDDGIRIID